ncbi:Small glutamine-rich tetratricopeptide repeat-containing alpha [Brachionus plicatilis]|uniref:Small glutamine-rich tetratricopeptide repeat-containing alpha n=1 Tax=Brachionus plicatilis TaxID=10195 RepID=A0A3M7R0Y1_BRAPC|nr:Small glutamine-rich tetratricopeptide repeat-containing alpha [Brachionus plicatilis]
MSLEAKRTLIFAILKFLRDELQQENIAADLKESLEVASQCLESSYEIAIDDEICKTNFDSGIDLLSIAEKSVIKRELPAEQKEKADKHKTEGNELMKQEKFNEALEQYNKAIEIDKSNAVYYCNRAAAYSKLSDFNSSIEDCKNALKIDPSYGKAWGRLGKFILGLALLSNNQNEEAYEAYNKAIQLEPNNEGYKQNLKIVEEKLKNSNPTGMPDMSQFGNMMSMFNNPQFMNMATQLMSDPHMQNVMSNLVGTMFGGANGQQPSEAAGSNANAPNVNAPSANAPNAEAPNAGFDSILNSAQQWAQQMNQANPELIRQMRERMSLGNNQGGPSSSSDQSKEAKN